VWAEKQLTPFCSACETRHQVCHRCRRSHWCCPPSWMSKSPCIDCGQVTDSWCPGRVHPGSSDGQGFLCCAQDYVSPDGWSGNALTSFCSGCASRNKVCHYCRGSK
jgi:hypothetical protein